MTVRELYAKLDEMIPRALSCDWDNDGLMCCPDGKREVRRVLVALDATDAAAEAAIRGKYDLILTHHPLIFKGLRSIGDDNYIAAKAIKLLREGIAVMSFHTRLDALDGGVNDALASAVGLEGVESFYGDGQPIGRVGELSEEMDIESFAKLVKEVLGAPFVSFSDAGKSVKRVAVVGGSGRDFIFAARAAGADTYLSGELGHHPMTDEPDVKGAVNLVEAGHFYTEQPVCQRLCDIVLQIDPQIVCDVFYSNPIKAI